MIVPVLAFDICPGSNLGLHMYVFGPETHMTAIVGMALGQRPVPKPVKQESVAQPVQFLGSKNVSPYTCTYMCNIHVLLVLYTCISTCKYYVCAVYHVEVVLV